MSGIRIGKWDCTTCGEKRIFGPLTLCPQCGSSRPENVKFYLETTADEVSDEKSIKEALSGADWVCGHCSTHNKANASSCQSCNNPKNVQTDGDKTLATKEHYFDQKEDKEKPAFLKDFERAPTQSWRQYGYLRLNNGDENPLPFFLQWIIRKINTLILSISTGFAALFALFSTATIDVPISAMHWERDVYYQEYKWVRESDWELPSNAKKESAEKAIHHYNKVLRGYETRTRNVREQVGTEQYKCGTKDMGNGYFQDIYCDRPVYENRREEYEEPIYDNIPVYQTKYTYQIMRWTDAPEPLREQGDNRYAQWPQSKLFEESDKYREARRSEKYSITIDYAEKPYTHELPEQRWQQLKVGGKIKAQKRRFSGKYLGLLPEK